MVSNAQLNIFDTNIVTKYRDNVPEIVRRYETVPDLLRSVAIITVEEQINGWYRQLRQDNTDERIARAYLRLADTVKFYAPVRILPYDEAAILRYRTLVALKLNVAKPDLRIAAIALVQNAVVITENVRDFGRIPGLAVVSWAEENT